MGASIKKLNSVVARARSEDAVSNAIRDDIVRVSNHAVLIEDRSLDDACRDAVDHISTQRLLARNVPKFRTAVLLRMVEHSSPIVRRLAAQNLPKGQLYRFIDDRDHAVRSEAARRMPLNELKIMLRKHPGDDSIASTHRQRISEANEGMLWMSGKKVGDAARTKDVPFTDAWYENLARIIYKDVGAIVLATSATPMYNLARQFAQHMKTTSGIIVDADKLVDCLQDLVDAHHERAEKDSIVLALESLKRKAMLQETELHALSDLSAVEELLEGSFRFDSDLAGRFEQIFMVEKSAPSGYARKELLRESVDVDDLPVRARIPGTIINEHHEAALDRYVDFWNRRWTAQQVPLSLAWSCFDENVEFEVIR